MLAFNQSNKLVRNNWRRISSTYHPCESWNNIVKISISKHVKSYGHFKKLNKKITSFPTLETGQTPTENLTPLKSELKKSLFIQRQEIKKLVSSRPVYVTTHIKKTPNENLDKNDENLMLEHKFRKCAQSFTKSLFKEHVSCHAFKRTICSTNW